MNFENDKCDSCSKYLTNDEIRNNEALCFECNQNNLIKLLALEMREARITFEEVIRKLINEVDR